MEANTSSFGDLGIAVNTAASLGATAISNSYGAGEWNGEAGVITSGNNGSCGGLYLCAGACRFDGPTGNGSPNGDSAFAGGAAPTPTNTPAGTATPTSTSTPPAPATPTTGSTPNARPTPGSTPTNTPTPPPTSTATATPTSPPTSTPTNTPVPTQNAGAD